MSEKKNVELKTSICHPKYTGYIPLVVACNEHGETVQNMSEKCFEELERRRRCNSSY
jgi:hypothetical protein